VLKKHKKKHSVNSLTPNDLKSFKIDLFLGRSFLVLLSLCIGFIICEYSSRFVLNVSPSEGYDQTSGFWHTPKPYVMFSSLPSKNPETSNANYINYLGYKGHPPRKDKKNEKRIFMLGGSTVFNGEEPIPRLLQREFKKRGYHNVKVFNFGVTSSVTRQDLIRVLFEVSELEPDLIIMYGGGNDLWRNDPRPGYPHLFAFYENNPLWTKDVSSYKLFPLMLYGSHIARYLFPQYFKNTFINTEKMYGNLHKNELILDNEAIQIYLKALYQASKIAKDLNSGFISFFQPMRGFYKNFSDKEEYNRAIELRRKTLEESKKYRSENFKFINISNIFSESNKNVFVDPLHLQPKAREKVAKTIFQYITDLYPKKLLVPSRSLAGKKNRH